MRKKGRKSNWKILSFWNKEKPRRIPLSSKETTSSDTPSSDTSNANTSYNQSLDNNIEAFGIIFYPESTVTTKYCTGHNII